MVRVMVSGVKGRMGQAVVACARRLDGVELVGGVDQGDPLEPLLEQADVVVDFSIREATAVLAEACARHGRPLVTGTTGHSEEQRREVLQRGTEIPIVWASNFSIGVNTLFWLTRKATAILGPAFDLEVIEMHHRFKQDAPSGTALTLARILAEARGVGLPEMARHGRQGWVGERTDAEIGIHSLRGGDVVGDHTVMFAAPGERVELTHKASSRETFANGALRAACWVLGQKPGLYSMQDVLGLEP